MGLVRTAAPLPTFFHTNFFSGKAEALDSRKAVASASAFLHFFNITLLDENDSLSPTHFATVFLWTPRSELLVLSECFYLQNTDSRILLV